MKFWIVYLCGIHSAALFIFHAFFWRLFNWKQDLKKLHYSNRAIIQIANLRLMHVFLMMAVLCFTVPGELVNTRLGHFLMAGFSLFWLGRTIEQFIFLRVHHPAVHLLTFIFLVGTILFALPVILT